MYAFAASATHPNLRTRPLEDYKSGKFKIELQKMFLDSPIDGAEPKKLFWST